MFIKKNWTPGATMMLGLAALASVQWLQQQKGARRMASPDLAGAHGQKHRPAPRHGHHHEPGAAVHHTQQRDYNHELTVVGPAIQTWQALSRSPAPWRALSDAGWQTGALQHAWRRDPSQLPRHLHAALNRSDWRPTQPTEEW